MSDQELLDLVDEYLRDNSMALGDLFDQLEIARANYSRWRKGRPISPKMRKKLMAGVMPTIATKSIKCYLDNCPAEPPPDRFLQVVLESWNGLTIPNRAKVAALAADLLEKSGPGTSPGEPTDDVGSDCPQSKAN